MRQLAYLAWDPDPGMFAFDLPLLHRPILWYGFFFALGFFVGYLVLTSLLRRYFNKDDQCNKKASKTAEQLLLYVLIGAVIGARLGDVLFYQSFAQLMRDPLSIIAVWEGGLASHGGAAGILIALYLYSKRQKIPFWRAVDFTVIPTALAAVFIRLGNFFNQEILGTPTTLPWGILFLHPADGGAVVPRHPAQLYEALGYLCVFAILLRHFRRHPPFLSAGKLTGLFLILLFGVRFCIEFIKVEQSVHLSSQTALLTMGQMLSIPFILLGCYLCFRRQSVAGARGKGQAPHLP